MAAALPPSTRLRAALMAGCVLLPAFVTACAQAPVTDRQQLMLVNEQQAKQMGDEAWEQIKDEIPASKDSEAQARVRRIGEKVAAASGATGIDWQFELFEDETPNAFALPGGHIGVNTGLLKIAKTDDQLAAVLAHEVGHVVARHPSEQMSQSAAIQTALQTAGVGDEAVGQLVQMATGVGQLSFSRTAESEADRIGLQYMARAGYNPEAAIALWQNMEAATAQQGRPPEFLSTHPNPAHRIEDIKAALPKVMPVYRANS